MKVETNHPETPWTKVDDEAIVQIDRAAGDLLWLLFALRDTTRLSNLAV